MNHRMPKVIWLILVSMLLMVGCDPLKPNPDNISLPKKQKINLIFQGNTQNKWLDLKIFDYDSITQTEKLELKIDQQIPDTNKISIELSNGPKNIYGQILDSETKQILVRSFNQVEVIPGVSKIDLSFSKDNRIKNLSIGMRLKTLGDIDKATVFYNESDESPKQVIIESCNDCHSKEAEPEDQVDPFFDSFPFVSKKPIYKDMGVLARRMLKDIQRDPKDSDVMPPDEGITDKDDISSFKKLASKLSQFIDPTKSKLKKVIFDWKVKHFDVSGTLELIYDEEGNLKGNIPDKIFKKDLLGGKITVLAENGTVVIKDSPVEYSNIITAQKDFYPQVTIDKSKIDIIIILE